MNTRRAITAFLRSFASRWRCLHLGFSALSFLTACALQPPQPTPLQALTVAPGMLPNTINLQTVQILQTQQVAGGTSVLYRWPGSQPDRSCLAATFMTPERGGWRAQSSGGFGCDVRDDESFAAGYTVGGNITPLTTAFGVANYGHRVEIEWSDGRTTTTNLVRNTFLLARPATVQAGCFRLLDRQGRVLATEDCDNRGNN